MSTMFIMNANDLEQKINDMLWPLLDSRGFFEGTIADIESVIAALENPAYQAPFSVYKTDPEMANHTDENTRKCFLFGMAFDDHWCKDDVFIIMIHESGKVCVRYY